MKYLRKFDSVSEMETAIASSEIDILGLAYDNGTPVIENKVIPPVTEATPFYINVRGAVTLAATSGLQMSTDGETWTGTTATTLPIGKTYFRVATDQEIPLKPNWTEDENSDYSIGGNINSLVKVNFENDTNCYTFYISNTGFFQDKAKLKSVGNLILPATILANQCYYGMFKGCTSLTTAPVLSATTLAEGCYREMFKGCISLTTAPVLSVTTLATRCYQSMFNGCTSLTTAPVLPATTLAPNCYASMFYNCTLLTTAPVLPATTLANLCYSGMFYGCTSLATAPELPATTLTEKCYYGMFQGCSSLANAPVLRATTLAAGCYQAMFAYCSSLTSAPALPATALADNCYNSMLVGTSLATAPALPAETMAFACYKWMFSECSKLVNVPAVLPATTLAENCYTGMFSECPSLTTTPELPATTLVAGCYQQLFQKTNVNYIKCLATDISASNCTKNWTDSVAATGTFVKNPNMSESTWGTGVNGIPSGWTVEDATE